MPVNGPVTMFYGNFQFVPVPLITWNTEYVRDSKLDELAIQHNLTLAGTFLLPASESGNFSAVMDRRQELTDALASGNQEFRILFDGQGVVSGVFPKIANVAFDEAVWADRINYSFALSYEEDFYNTGISSFSETWAFNETEDRRSATVQHDISAVGLDTAGSGVNNALTNARTFVLGRTGYSNVPVGHPAFVQTSGMASAIESHSRAEQVDVAAGSVQVTEQFILSSGNFTHTQEGSFETDENGITSVSVQGNIQGLGRGDVAFVRALGAFNDNIRPKLPASASGIYSNFGGEATLFTSDEQSFSVTQSVFLGTIGYSATYSDAPNTNLPSGIKEFSITLADSEPVRLFASFPIFERSLGNVVQDVSTPTEGTITINGSAVGKQGFAFASVLSFVTDEINKIRPIVTDYVTLRQTQQQITKDESSNMVQFSLEWTYTQDLSSAAVVGDVIID